MHCSSPSAGTLKLNKTQDSVGGVEQKIANINLINQIIKLRDESGMCLIQKFDIDSILGNIQKHQIEIVELFSKYLKQGFNLLEFVRFFLNIIPHNHIENLYLTIGLVDLFREITMQTHKDKIVLKDITDYMCDKILKNDRSFNKIQAKFLPFNKFVQPNKEKKYFLQLPPSIFGETDQKIHKLCQKSIKTDSSKHSRAIIKSQFSFDLKKVFILDALTQSISVYDQNCNLIKKISPILTKLKKQVIILSFAFSRRQYRIGAVLKDFSLKFWDHFNDFQYQKSISTTSICQNLQTNIYFLEYFNSWITTDKTGTLHFWNILEQKPDRNLKCKYNTNVNDLCQIPALNLLAVVQQCKRSSKLIIQNQEKQWQNGVLQATVVIYNYYNGHIITQIDLQGQRIPHTIIYSQTYQALFMSGLQKKIKIYDLHPKYMDASLKGELIGHENLITCFTLISGTPMLVSADDKGKVKLWDFRNYMCLQTIDFSDKTVITNLLDMIQIGKFGVFGSRVNYIEFQDKYQITKKRNQEQNLKIDSFDFDSNSMEMFVFANKAMRVIDLFKGQIKHIFSFKHNPSDQQYTTFRYFSCQKKFVFGSSKGEISIFNPQLGELQSVLKQNHEGSVSFIEYDQFNKLYVSAGYDSKILIHRASDGTMIRELKNNFNGKQINCIQVSVYHNLLIIGSNSCSRIYIWNYQYGKIIGEIQLRNQFPVSFHIINGYGLLLVGTNLGRVYMFRILLSSIDLEMELLDQISLSKNIISVFTDLKLIGRGKNTQCQFAKVIICCQNGQIFEFDILEFMKRQSFKFHCKEKSNYNPYRQGKQNFISQIQKLKHKVLSINQNKDKYFLDKIFRNQISIFTEFSALNSCKLLKLEQSFKVIVGNDRRIKLWDHSYQLLCDLNINYCLPYKWDLKPTSLAITTEKIYYGIKVLQTIVKKYENDISIGQAKNLQIKQLFQIIEKAEKDKNSSNKMKMITEPGQIIGSSIKFDKSRQITLLQNEYSRKDLNFELVKRFNFTEIAGPSLKQLDNIKKIDMLQREWKLKENKQQKQKQLLLKNIENKAKKNEEKDQIQFLFVKQKKHQSKQVKIENDKINTLAKKLHSIENKPLNSSEDKKCMTTFYKNIYNRFAMKMDTDANGSFIDQKLNFHQSQPRIKKSFQEYYQQRYKKQKFSQQKKEKQNNFLFRDIITQMNGRVNSIKKYRYRRNQTNQN